MVPLERWQARNAPHRWKPSEGWHRRAERALPEARLASVRRGFRQVSRRLDRAVRLRWLGRWGERSIVAAVAAFATYVALLNLSP